MGQALDYESGGSGRFGYDPFDPDSDPNQLPPETLKDHFVRAVRMAKDLARGAARGAVTVPGSEEVTKNAQKAVTKLVGEPTTEGIQDIGEWIGPPTKMVAKAAVATKALAAALKGSAALKGGGGAVASIFARNAKGAPLEMLDKGERMLEKGGDHGSDFTHADVLHDTGTFQSPDKIQKFSVSDKGMVIDPKALKQAQEDSYKGSLAGAVRHHKGFGADPSLKDVQVELSLGPHARQGGEYDKATDSFWAGAYTEADLKNLILHEGFSHAGQARAAAAGIPVSEGSNARVLAQVLRKKFPTAPQEEIDELAKKMYFANIGEAEARIPGFQLENPFFEKGNPRNLYRPESDHVLWSEKTPGMENFDLDVAQNKASIDALRSPTKYSLPSVSKDTPNLLEIAKKTGKDLYGEGYVPHSEGAQVKEMPVSQYAKEFGEDEVGGPYVTEYAHTFHPSTGKGFDSSMTGLKPSNFKKLADKDGHVYLSSSEDDNAIYKLTNDIKDDAEYKRLFGEDDTGVLR